MPTEEQAPELFEAFTSQAAVVGYVFSLYGSEGVKDLFKLPGMESRPAIEAIAAELRTMRLTKLSKLLAEIASTKPERDRRNPFPSDSLDGRIWQEDRERGASYTLRD